MRQAKIMIAVLTVLCALSFSCQKEEIKINKPKRGLNVQPPPSESESGELTPNGL